MNNSYIYPYQNTTRNNSIRASYSDNFLSMNKGRKADFYLSFKNSKEWQDTIFKGIIQEVGNDYTLIKDITTGKLILIYNMYIDYVIFDD